MDSSWLGLGLDDFFSSSRLSSRRSRVSLRSELPRSRLGERFDRQSVKIDFGPDGLDFDSVGFPFGESLLREFDDFPRKTSSKLHSKTKEFAARAQEQSGDAAEGARSESDFESVRELRLKLHHCQDEIMKLQVIIRDLTHVNKRWQKYSSERQLYVQGLLSTIQDQQEQLNLIGENRSLPSSSSHTTPTAAGQSSPLSCEAELERLRSAEQKLKEKVSILEFQVKAHRDDWEAELNEKRQALKDKEAAERKVSELTRDLLLLAPSGEARGELYCQNCGRVTEVDRSPPSRSRLYRTAVHLPCSSSRHSSSTSISTTGEDLVLDSEELRLMDSRTDSEEGRMWNIRPDDISYSRCSTVPLISPPPTVTSSSASSIGGKPASVTVKSFVQIPITKSSSVPERSAKLTDLSRKSLHLFESTCSPPVSVINSAEQYDGTATNSAENVICLRCGEVFPPDMHLQFLDHFPRCQSSRRQRMVSRNGAPNV